MSNTTLTDLTGTRLGEYLVTARLGTGGMGVVYEGVQPVIGKKVAVKVLLPQLMADPSLVERFLAEARAVNAIRHRGIVDIFGFGELPGGALYFVMELLEGVPFDALLKREGALEPSRVMGYLEEILDALDAVHAVGITHRDIKPSNIFLVVPQRGRPYVKLLDFGIAKLGGTLQGSGGEVTRVNMVLGTPNYMAPEQVRAEAVGPATDLYSLGCVLFELLTGERPFAGGNAMDTMMMHVQDPPRRVSAVRHGVPDALDALVAWMLEKQPRARPPSARALLEHVETLRNAVAAQPLPWPPPAPAQSPAPELEEPTAQTTQVLRPEAPKQVRPGALGAAASEVLATEVRPARQGKAVEGEERIPTVVRPAPKAQAVESEAAIPTLVRPAPAQSGREGAAIPTELSRAAPFEPVRTERDDGAIPTESARGSPAPLPEVLPEQMPVVLEAARPVTLNAKLEVLDFVAQPELSLGGEGAGPVPNLELPQLEALTLPGGRPPSGPAVDAAPPTVAPALDANPSAEAGPIPAPVASGPRPRGRTPASPIAARGPVPDGAAAAPTPRSPSSAVPLVGVLVGMAVAAAAMASAYSRWVDARPEPQDVAAPRAVLDAPADTPGSPAPHAAPLAPMPSPFATPVLAVDAGRAPSRPLKPARLKAGELARKLEALRTKLEARESKGPQQPKLHVMLDEAERELLGPQSDEALARAAKSLGQLQRALETN